MGLTVSAGELRTTCKVLPAVGGWVRAAWERIGVPATLVMPRSETVVYLLQVDGGVLHATSHDRRLFPCHVAAEGIDLGACRRHRPRRV